MTIRKVVTAQLARRLERAQLNVQHNDQVLREFDAQSDETRAQMPKEQFRNMIRIATNADMDLRETQARIAARQRWYDASHTT